MSSLSPQRTDRYVHDALFYSSGEELVGAASDFLRAGLDAGQRAVLICTDEHNQALRAALRDDERVVALPREAVDHRPAPALAYYRSVLEQMEAQGPARVRLVGEVAYSADPARHDQWRRFEAACNHVLAPFPLWSLCAYDTTLLPDPLLATAEATHPYVCRGGRRAANPEYVDTARLLSPPERDLAPVHQLPPTLALTDVRGTHEPRRRLREVLGAAEMDAALVEDLLQALTELVANALRHGEPPVTVRAWTLPARVVCTVTDQGAGFVDPLVGYRPGGDEGLPDGRFGLWLARQLCDALVTDRGRDGFCVSIALDLPS